MNSEPSLPLHTKIKEEEDASNIIDLDLDKTPEDLVHEWESKVRVKFKECAIVESEHSLDILMKWYIKLIKEEAVNLEDFRTLKKFVMNHLLFLKLYFVELNCCFVDNYLDNMEEILSFYVNVEVKLLPAKQQSGNKRTYKRILSTLCHQIISVLNLYLLNREDRVCHVVMKVKLNLQSGESKDLLNILYGNFLMKRPKEKSDLEFCRAYILYQKWKTIRKPDDWEKMDEVMYNLHERTPDSIKSSPILKQILLPQNNSILDTLTHISEKHLIISEEYFKYIKSNKLHEDNIIASGIDDIEIQDDDIISDLVGDAEDQEFEEAYKIHVRSMSCLYLENIRGSLEAVNIKEENESDDEDCQIVAVSSLGKNRDDADMVHEILEDDDMEIIYMTKKDDKQNAPQEDKGKGSTLSFLESIKVSESRDVSMERVSSSTSNGYASLPGTNSLIETSSKTEVVIADSPMSDSLGQKPSQEIPNIDTVTSAAGTEPLQEVTPVESELTERRDDTNHPSKAKSVIDVGAVEDVSESNPSPTVKKSVVSIETQTDEWPMDEANDKSSSSEKHADQSGICRNYYYYGLDTPPSDQLPDEQIPPVPESATYPKVYANIVRSHSPNEADSLTKATETDRLSPSVDDNDNDDNSKRSADLTPNSVVQSEPCSSRSINENSPNFIEAEFIPNVAPNTRKKHKNLEKPLENKTNRLDSTDIESNTKKKRKRSKKPPENNEIRIDTIFTPDVEPNTKKKHKKLSKPPESKQQLLNTLFTPGVESSAKKKHKNLNKPSENNPNLLEASFISDVEPNTKKKRKKFNKPPENNPNLLDAEFRPDIEPNTKKKRKKLNKTPENNPKHPYAAFTPNVEPEMKKKRKKLHKQPENSPKRKKFNKTPGFDDPCSSRRSTSPRTLPNCEENQVQHVSNNFQSNDSVPVGEGRSFPQTHTDLENISSLDISTNAYHKTADTSSRANLRSPSPLKYRDSNIHETSTNVPCTSLDVVITSAESNSTVFNEQRKSADISNASPDVTSTSMDVQDFGETLCNGEIHIEESQLVYHHLSVDTTHNENYSSEEYVEYAECSGSGEFNNESVTQSNIVEDGEIYIEEPVLMTSGEEFTYFVHETLPVGANVNIYSEELSPNSHVVDADHESARTETEKHDQPAVSLKELKVSVEKIRLGPHDRADISSVDEFSKFEERVQQWTKLRETHDLDEIFCGPVSKINETSSCVNPDANFDLFNSKPCNSAVQSTSEVTSPPYEAIEDFRTYFEESKNNGEDVPSTSSKAYADENIATTSAIIPDPPHSTDNSKVTGLLIPRTLESLQDVGETSGSAAPSDDSVLSPRSVERTKSKNTRRVHIDEEAREFKERPVKIHQIGVLRSILKKSCENLKVEAVVPKSRILPEQMNPNSLEEYGIAPDDVLLQSIPCVSLSRLGENVIARWLRMSEIAFKLRQLRQKTHNGPGKPIKVEYDKQISPHINNKDMVQYNANGRKVKTPLPDTFGQWRTATVPQTQSDRLDEGTVTTNLNDNDSANIPPQCTKSYKSLIVGFTKLKILSTDVKCSSPKSNPFLPQTDTKREIHLEECPLNVDVVENLVDSCLEKKLDSQVVSNIESDLNLSQINNMNESQQPAVVPEVSAFEKTFELEDIVKMSPIPADLHNLSLQKFSPSPCFSPQSDAFLTDAYLLDKPEMENTVKIRECDETEAKEAKEEAKSENVPKPGINLLENEAEIRLPLKKRKHSVANTKEETVEDDNFMGPDLVEEIIKRARAEEVEKEDISYPAKPMISIAEIQEKLVEPPRVFKTPAERKEMPPPPPQSYPSPIEAPKIVTEQYNNHTYNNPTINYHMNNVPYPFFPCASLSYFPPILLPLNSTTTFDMNLMNTQQQSSAVLQEQTPRPRKERRSRGRKRNT